MHNCLIDNIELQPNNYVNNLEKNFDITFTAGLATKEKQIQQNYRPIIGIHKWFARRPGTVFRNLLLAEFNCESLLQDSYWQSHNLKGVLADPFMGGGTPIFEANRLGFSVVGADINPMAFWLVRQSLMPLDLTLFAETADTIVCEVEKEIGHLYNTACVYCGEEAKVKYFLWVKTQACPDCGTVNDLFPGYLLAEKRRHPKHVVVCRNCGYLNEYDRKPSKDKPEKCQACNQAVYVDGNAKRNKAICKDCGSTFSYPPRDGAPPPEHRLWAMEYHCQACNDQHKGRFFKQPDWDDFSRFQAAETMLNNLEKTLPIPDNEILQGDETKRLHRWGYRTFRELFNRRQLLGLGLLLAKIVKIQEPSVKNALLTVFSDFLRYQNMLCRYDTYALKCQDIFSIHAFPVGLIQCENNLLGIPKIGSGAFRHFVQKYYRAKQYCEQPFETQQKGTKKKVLPIVGERIEAKLLADFPGNEQRAAWINCRSAETISLPPHSLDGVFTDPPYFDNVQYAELVDFNYAWLRLALKDDFAEFKPQSTRHAGELTGNNTMGRDLQHFTEGLSRIFCHYADALKPGAPFVFTFHHNEAQAYVPLIVAILDTGLDCTATLPVPAEMSASLHIARTNSSVLDSVFVCRKVKVGKNFLSVEDGLERDCLALTKAGLKLTAGDINCLTSGHVARITINKLKNTWNSSSGLIQRMSIAETLLVSILTDKPYKDRVIEFIS